MIWFIAVLMDILVVASFIIGAISVVATGNILWLVIWIAGIVSGGANVGYAVRAMYEQLTSDQE